MLHAASALESRVEEQLAEVGLSLPKLAALHQLSQAGDSLPLGQLAERLACVKSNVTQLVDRLEADGLVVRAADPNDRRSRLAVITDSGTRAYERGIQIQQRAEREIFGALSKEESSALHELLDKIAR
ncbi:MAG TPA: MarR family transcriptional regulator [Vicinamibacterales bacterium]|nr:MarR family transcriptional regulator [Vicinamibacterales bacterium]